jgi:PKD repeat protein
VASFYGVPTTGTIPFNVSFHDTSANTPTSWNWSFGDGTANNTTQNPVHQYTAAGTYTVIMTATNAFGSDTETVADMITANNGSLPVAAFYGSPTNGTIPLNVTFHDTSSGSPTTWNWSFGDGGGNSTDQNPTHSYAVAGTYNVTLTVTNAFGSNTTVILGYIGATSASEPVASFYGLPTSGSAPLMVNFTDTSSNTPTSWVWSWGDATSNGTTQNPSHTYSTAGTYTVTLTVSNAGGSNTSQIAGMIVVSAVAPTPTPTPTPRPIYGGGSAAPYQPPDVPFPTNNATGVHMVSSIVNNTTGTVTFTGTIDNTTADPTAWFVIGSTLGDPSIYTVALVPDAGGNITTTFPLTSPLMGGNTYYVYAASTHGRSTEVTNFSVSTATPLPTSNFSKYYHTMQTTNRTPLALLSSIPLPVVDLFGAGSTAFGWQIFFTLIFGMVLIILAVRQDSIYMIFVLAGLCGSVFLAIILPDMLWLFAAVCVMAAAATIYRLYRKE